MATIAELKRQKELFERALDLNSEEDRAQFLAAACAGDPALLERLQALLRANEKDKGFLPGTPTVLARDAMVTEKPGDRIGRYRLREKLGEGGCGVVYVAEQEDGIRRRVALKVIKLGMDTRSVVARFDAERQALAMMDHPGIAKVLDAGATESGRPYFVMELVHGVSITEYCDKADISPRERLELFIKVCQAVQHAHQKGIIHRDLKPSNILVTLHDGVSLPKIIDFGVAKAIEGRLTDLTVYTDLYQFIGTPAYMSPEQAEMRGLDIDTRSDIYSLGVLLYELLTGKTPLDTHALLAEGLDGMRRSIREKEPLRPSTRLSQELAGKEQQVGERRKPEAAVRRVAQVKRMLSVVRGDLDWIVMKCIEKEREHRYETANSLAMDLRRHLNNDPVIARPQSRSYRLQKLVRRNKLVFATGAIVAAALMLGLATSTWSFLSERSARRRAVSAEIEEGRLREQAQLARASEAKARALAEGRLYDSLVRQAGATRLARRVGYRVEVFKLLRQAAALDVPQKDLAELRREAVACLGDFVGLAPAMLTGFPPQEQVALMRVDPGGQVSAFATEDGMILLRQLPGGGETGRFMAGGDIWSLCFNSLGNQLFWVSGKGEDLADQLRNAAVDVSSTSADGRWIKGERAALSGAFAVLSSTRGQFVAVADSSTRTLRLIDFASRSEVLQCEYPPVSETLPEVALSAEGRYFAAAIPAADPKSAAAVRLWDLSNNAAPHRFEPRLVGAMVSLSFSPDGKQLGCLAAVEGAIYATEGFERLASFRGESFERPATCAFASGSTLAVLPLAQQSRVRLWDWTTSEGFASLEEPRPVTESFFSEDGKFLFSHGSRYARVYRLDLANEKLNLGPHSGGTPGIAFSSDGSMLASVGKDHTLCIRDSWTGRLMAAPSALGQSGQSVAFYPGGRVVVTGGLESDSAAIWDPLTGKRLGELGIGMDAGIWTASFSPDGEFFATALGNVVTNGGVRIYSVGQRLGGEKAPGFGATPLKSFSGSVWGLNFSPDSRHVAFADCRAAGSLYFWDFCNDTSPRVLATNRISYVQCESFTPDGRRLLYVANHREVVALDLPGGAVAYSFPTLDPKSSTKSGPVNLCLSPDGTKLALSSPSRLAVDIWDPKAGRLLSSLPEQNGTVWYLAWSPDSQRLAISRSDGEVAIWNTKEVERVLAELGLHW
jgi:serine/threonine protein kinase/WD40 repeat protein